MLGGSLPTQSVKRASSSMGAKSVDKWLIQMDDNVVNCEPGTIKFEVAAVAAAHVDGEVAITKIIMAVRMPFSIFRFLLLLLLLLVLLLPLVSL